MAEPAFVESAFIADHPALARNIRLRLEKRRKEAALDMEVAQDWPDYKQRQGYLRGIDDAIQMCSEADNQLRK